MTPRTSHLRSAGLALMVCMIAHTVSAHDIDPRSGHVAVLAPLHQPAQPPTNLRTVATIGTCETSLAAFEGMSTVVSVSCDDDWLTFNAPTGLPPAPASDEDEIMVGITAWIQRVPLPFNYAWRLPAQPDWLSTPQPASARGPIAVAIDGVPIFHYDKRPDADTSLAQYRTDIDTVVTGELDQCGGHSGQGDDYHYHYAPVCLIDRDRLEHPIAFGLDGIPIYFGTGGNDYYGRGRFSDIDRLPASGLDDCNGARLADGSYVYYTTREPPYVLGCHHAVADPALRIEPRPLRERDQRVASPFGVGELGEPVQTLITDYYIDADGWHHLEFNALAGSGTSAVLYRRSDGDGDCWLFENRLDASEPAPRETACR